MHSLRKFVPRLIALGIIAALLILAQFSMNILPHEPLYHFKLYDLGHRIVPDLELTFGLHAARWIWWVGSISIEVGFALAILAIALFGKGLRLGIALALIALLHSIFWHATILPVPPHIVWRFPYITGQIPKADDFWFSGHVAYATLFILFYSGKKWWIYFLGVLYIVLIAALVLSTRTHYSIDVIGSLFIAYAIYKMLTNGFLDSSLTKIEHLKIN